MLYPATLGLEKKYSSLFAAAILVTLPSILTCLSSSFQKKTERNIRVISISSPFIAIGQLVKTQNRFHHSLLTSTILACSLPAESTVASVAWHLPHQYGFLQLHFHHFEELKKGLATSSSESVVFIISLMLAMEWLCCCMSYL